PLFENGFFKRETLYGRCRKNKTYPSRVEAFLSPCLTRRSTHGGFPAKPVQFALNPAGGRAALPTRRVRQFGQPRFPTGSLVVRSHQRRNQPAGGSSDTRRSISRSMSVPS